MKIAIDLSQIIYGTGVSHYRENLVRNLLKIDSKNEYVLYAGSLRRKQDILNFFPQTKVFPIPPRLAHFVWNKLHILPIEKLIGQVDVIHTSDWAEPPSALPKITTIHDLVPLVLPKFTPKIIVETHKDRLKWVSKESRRIIAPSLATKEDLIKLGINEDKITVIYEAPNFSKATSSEVEAVKKKYSIHEDYIIMIGTNPRKNIERSVKAFHLAKHGKNLKLLIIGENKGLRLEDERGVRFLGFVSTSDLSSLFWKNQLFFPLLCWRK